MGAYDVEVLLWEVRDLVRAYGLRKLAREIGMDSGSLCRAIRKGANPYVSTLERILGGMGYDLVQG